MNRELILLSPYRFPTHNTLMLSAEDVAVLLNGCLALWHPSAVAGAASPPKLASPYDHEQPAAGHLYGVPESPPLFLPDDWEHRVREAGAAFFRVTSDRQETVNNLLKAIAEWQPPPTPEGVPEAAAEPVSKASEAALASQALFFAVGLGYVVLDALFEAMDHIQQLAVNDFWLDVTRAATAGDDAACRQHLQAAADRLKEAREVLYPSNILLVDLALLEDLSFDGPLPAAIELGSPLNLIASGERLEKLAATNPEWLRRIQAAVQTERVELCGGPYLEREDAVQPLESQLWNLRKGQETYRKLLGHDIQVFARKRFGVTPQLPQLLRAVGMHKAILLPFDEGVIRQHQVAVIEWTAPDGKTVQAFTRTTHATDSPLTYFHLAYHLARTMLHDPCATLALLTTSKPQASYYRDWLELSQLAHVFGRHVTLTQFFIETPVGEYPPVASADDFHSDYLLDLHNVRAERLVSRFAHQARQRRRVESAWTLAGLHRGLMKPALAQPGGADTDVRPTEPVAHPLATIEDAFELGQNDALEGLDSAQQPIAESLAERLLSRATGQTPGHLILNTCGFPRRVAVELDGVKTPLPAPAKATQIEGDRARVVVEVPPLGFAWLPLAVTPGTKVAIPRIKLAEGMVVRNEFFEAEIDAQSGGLRLFRDARGRTNRLGQQLVYGPGSAMRAKETKVTSSGPAVGEVVSEGALFDGQENVIATFRQRFRAWWGRPLLEIRIEVYPTAQPSGYPWHAYYGARFAWRGERVPLFRGVNGLCSMTSHTRPETPDFLELRALGERTLIVPGGLPFHQRHSQRMLDVILYPEGETCQVFELALGLEIDEPMQAAQDYLTPGIVVPVAKGPPHIGASGWLFHIDAPNVLLTSLRPVVGADAVVARLVECRGVAVSTELRCVRDPVKAVLVDERDTVLSDVAANGDAVPLDFAAAELKRVRIDFS